MVLPVICFAHCKSQYQRVPTVQKHLKEVIGGERWAVCLLRVGMGHPWSRVSPSSPWAGLVNHKEPPSDRPQLFHRYSTISFISMFSPLSWGCTCSFPAFPQAAGGQSCLFIIQNTHACVSWGNSWLVWWETGTKQAIIITFGINIKMTCSNLHGNTVYQSGEWNTDFILSFLSRGFLRPALPTYLHACAVW